MKLVSASQDDILNHVDHLVYGTPDLELGIQKIESLLGIQATPGGQHPRWGTRNALIALGPATYLEVIGPDPDGPQPKLPRPFGIDDLKAPRLVTWAAKSTNLDQLVSEATRRGIILGEVNSGSRKRTDGLILKWRLTDPGTVVADGIVPFFIDWGKTPHPALTAAQGALLISLRAEHPELERVSKMLTDLRLALPVQSGPKPALIATINSPRGKVEL